MRQRKAGVHITAAMSEESRRNEDAGLGVSSEEGIQTQRRAFMRSTLMAWGAAAVSTACGGGEEATEAARPTETAAAGPVPVPKPATPAPPPPAPVPPPPPPAPAPTPAPPPPPGQVYPTSKAIIPSKVVTFVSFADNTYERFQQLTLMSGASWDLPFRGADYSQAGGDRVLSASRYRLLVDGIERVAINIPTGTKRTKFTLPLSNILDGWHLLEIASDAGETSIPWVAFMQKGTVPLSPTTMPVVLGSHGFVNGFKAQRVFHAFVPAKFKPITLPAPARVTPAFADALARSSLVQTEVVPWRDDDIYRTRLTNGVLNSFNTQAYFWSSLVSPYPNLALLDGPRGVGSAGMVTHLQVGRIGGVYFTDPWRVGHVTPDGTVKTLAGYRHKAPAPRPTKQNNTTLKGQADLVGDWSAIPAARQGFHEIWGMAWDQRSLTMNEAASPVLNTDNGVLEKPHVAGPRLFVADSQNNRICLLAFSAVSHDVPAVVTEFKTGLSDPWDVVCVDGVLYVSERQSHRIAAYDATTGAFIRAVVQGKALAVIDQNRFVKRSADFATIRAERCVAPEGLYYQDGWLYFASLAMAQIRRINLSTGVLEVVVAEAAQDGNSNFMKIAVSDGSFGPRGAVFLSTWSVRNAGRPVAYLPNGAGWNYVGVTTSYGAGPGPVWETLGYSTAPAVGQGRLVCGSSTEGITSHSKALPTDAVIPFETWTKWKSAYHDLGLELTHGPGGWGYYGLPQPWGISANIDAYLSAHGHVKF